MSATVRSAGLVARPYYAHAVARAGVPVFLTGQVAWDEHGAVVGVGDISSQVEQVWRNIAALVDAAGAEMSDIVKLTTYATSREFLPAIHTERAKHFAPGRFPASTFLQIAGLAEPELLVEIEATLMLPADHRVFDGQVTAC